MISKVLTAGMKINLDGLGIAASILCAIHCAVLPLLFSSIPLLGINIVSNPFFEFGMIGLAFIIGANALRHGYRRHHHRFTPFVLFTIGFGFLLSKELLPVHRSWMVLPALVFIVAAHVINFRLCRKDSKLHPGNCSH
jgi:hypothetical protein